MERVEFICYFTEPAHGMIWCRTQGDLASMRSIPRDLLLSLLLFAMAHGWEQKGGAWRWSIALYPGTDRRSHLYLHLQQADLV